MLNVINWGKVMTKKQKTNIEIEQALEIVARRMVKAENALLASLNVFNMSLEYFAGLKESLDQLIVAVKKNQEESG